MKHELEPTRSVLFRSAATLALECCENQEAERLAIQGLAGNPPSEIADELRTVFEEATFKKHLSIRGVHLLPEEFQISIAGPAISSGIARSDTVLGRVRSLENLVYRTADRTAGVEYRTSGRRQEAFVQNYQMYLSTPRAGSFALSIHLGQSGQGSFPGLAKAEPVIDELFACLELFGSSRETELRARIPNDAYHTNFISNARKVAPDGDAVRWVGLTALRDGAERHVELTSEARPSAMDVPPMTEPETVPERYKIRGVLRWADWLREIEKVRIVDADGRSHTIRLPAGADDIVKPHWLDEVIAQVRRGPRGTLILEDIEAAS